MALVEGLEGRFALLKAGDGGMLADGESLYADREEAIGAFEAARDVGWPVYATRGLVEGAVDLDVETLSPSRGMAMRRAPLAGWSARRAAGAGVVVAAAAGGVGAHVFSDEIWRWFVGPEEVAEEEVEAERTVSAAIDGARLVEGCRAALAARPPALAGWELIEVICEASLSDPGLQAQRPEMIDRPALVVRWRLDPAHAPASAVWRRVAEGQLAEGWYAAGVNAADAWATQPLPPVLALVPQGFGSGGFLAFRAAVDRVFGAGWGGARVRVGRAGRGSFGEHQDEAPGGPGRGPGRADRGHGGDVAFAVGRRRLGVAGASGDAGAAVGVAVRGSDRGEGRCGMIGCRGRPRARRRFWGWLFGLRCRRRRRLRAAKKCIGRTPWATRTP